MPIVYKHDFKNSRADKIIIIFTIESSIEYVIRSYRCRLQATLRNSSTTENE